MKLEIKDIRKSFSNKEILHGISFEINSGKAMGFLGRNGAGKTTTFRCLMDVFRQDSGQFLLDGQPLDIKKHKIGYLPEERGLYGKASVLDQLVYFAQLRGLTHQEAKQNAQYWIEQLGLTDYTNKAADTLSKGNQQKVQIAQALVHNPDILVLDEPFSGLDPVNSQLFKDIIKQQVSQNKVVIFSSHQMAYVEEMCDDVTLLNQGSVVLSGDLKQIKQKFGNNRWSIEVDSNSQQRVYETLSQMYEVQRHDDKLIVTLSQSMRANELVEHVLQHCETIVQFGQFVPTLHEIFVESVGK